MKEPDRIELLNASTEYHFDEVRKLVRAFVNWHRQRHLEDIELIDEYFDAKAFEEELASLPGKYSAPKGCLLLAFYGSQPAGCVALRGIDNNTCEMKRMFVYDKYHGRGIGRALAEAVIQKAQNIGYSSMKLDTSFRQIEAQRLYESCGFKKTSAYYELPKKLEDWLVFMELKL